MALEDNCPLGGWRAGRSVAGDGAKCRRTDGVSQVTGQSVAGLQKTTDLRQYFASVADLRRR